MVSISLSEGAIRHVGRRQGAGIIVYREMLRNGAFLPKATVGKAPGSLFILADNRSIPVWVEKAFFSQLEDSMISLSLDRGVVRRIRIEMAPLPAGKAGYLAA
ncbi:MAG: hypothetical protein ACREAY_03505 [Nitrososphaera sp.]|uniref:hypothetical protein n=1 Tax=Nitrososphaera sp. TaxID=1971748 RepID=UPI003D6E52DF